MIEWTEVARGADDLILYRLDAEMDHLRPPGGGGFDPMRSILGLHPTSTTRQLEDEFAASVAPVGASSMRVACHIISYPDQLMVVDSTFPATGTDVFPGALEQISQREGRSFEARPLDVLYTHCHFDHAGGRDAVEALGDDVRILAHPYTQALFDSTHRREMFFLGKAQLFRDCGIAEDVDTLMLSMRDLFAEATGGKMGGEMFGGKTDGEEADEEHRNPYAPLSDSPLRVDVPLEPNGEAVRLHGGRVEVLRFEGHIPGHLCVRVGREHLISGDMWLPATTSTVTPPGTAERAGIPRENTGVKLYIDSSARLLSLDVDECFSYPSHEAIFENPKRMAMRDLELYHERFVLMYDVLAEHKSNPMRVLDLAWGGERRLPLWKLESSLYRLMMAHDEAAAYVHDLVSLGDLEEVEPERYIYTGRVALMEHLESTLEQGRKQYGHLDFRSYRRKD